jgi:Fe-S cluster biosynthesis and repair protein YggX
MDVIEGYLVNNDTSYYVYPINPDTFQELITFYNKQDIDHYLPLYEMYNIKAFDIIFIWIKTTGAKNKQSKFGHGIGGFCQVQKKVIKNKNIKIVKDNNIQRFIVELDSICIFNNTLTKKILEENLKENIGYSHAGFSRKYCKGELKLEELPPEYGQNIFKYVAQKASEQEEEKEQELINSKINNKEKNIKILEQEELNENKNGDLDLDKDTNKEPHNIIKKGKNIYIDEDTIPFSQIRKNKEPKIHKPQKRNVLKNKEEDTQDTDDLNFTETDKNESEEMSDDYDSDCELETKVPEDPEHKFGYIPIMVIPCKSFKFPVIMGNQATEEGNDAQNDESAAGHNAVTRW